MVSDRRRNLKNRGRNRNRGVDLVWVIVNMRDNNKIYIMAF